MAYPLAERKATGSHSEIDNLIGMNDLKQWWDSVKGKNILGQEVAPFSEEDMLDMAMSVSSPMAGTVGSGKGIMSIFKSLLGRAKSKRKFPIGYGQSTEDWMEVQKALEKMETVKPKGMRQFGKFNRQRNIPK